MTLEQRVEALEKELAGMKAQQRADEEVGELMRKLTEEAIKNAQRPGGIQHAAQNQTAKIEATSFVIYEKERDRLLDIATSLTHDSLQLSRL